MEQILYLNLSKVVFEVNSQMTISLLSHYLFFACSIRILKSSQIAYECYAMIEIDFELNDFVELIFDKSRLNVEER